MRNENVFFTVPPRGPTYPIFKHDLYWTYLRTNFGGNRIEITTCRVITNIHIHTHIHTENLPLILFVKKLHQLKVGLAGYDILLTYFVVEKQNDLIAWNFGLKILGIYLGFSECVFIIDFLWMIFFSFNLDSSSRYLSKTWI